MFDKNSDKGDRRNEDGLKSLKWYPVEDWADLGFPRRKYRGIVRHNFHEGVPGQERILKTEQSKPNL